MDKPILNKKLTKNQMDAIKKLENAFAVCKKAGLVFYGMDDNLLALTRSNDLKMNEYMNDTEGKGSYCLVNAQYEFEELQHEILTHVNTHEVYLDSGGW